jgi:hypothetical protein
MKPGPAPVSDSHSQLRSRVARIRKAPPAGLPAGRKPCKSSPYDGNPRSTFLYCLSQPRVLSAKHEDAHTYEQVSRHDRKKQPDNSAQHESRAESYDGDPLKSFLRLRDSDLLHSGSSQRVDSPNISVVSASSGEHRRRGNGWLSQRQSIQRQRQSIQRPQFSYAVCEDVKHHLVLTETHPRLTAGGTRQFLCSGRLCFSRRPRTCSSPIDPNEEWSQRQSPVTSSSLSNCRYFCWASS